MRSAILTVSLASAVAGAATGYPGQHTSPPETHSQWSLQKFTSLVTFGDSYTDDSLLQYFADHNGSAPPVGYVNPAVTKTPSYISLRTHHVPADNLIRTITPPPAAVPGLNTSNNTPQAA